MTPLQRDTPVDAAGAEPQVTRSSECRARGAGAGAASSLDGSDVPARKAGLTLSLKGRALRHLAAREHSRAELERKLAAYEESPGQLAQVLDELAAKNFISESRVVESVVHRRSAKLGALRVLQELQAKGLPAELIAGAVDALQASEHERALALWLKRFGAQPVDAKDHARQARFLMSRGFSGSVVSRILRSGPHDE